MEDDIRMRAGQIRSLLLESRLREALELIYLQMNGMTDWSVVSQYEDLDRSYRYMLQYFRQGAGDEHRHQMYTQFLRRALILNDDVLQTRLHPTSMMLFYQHRRSRMSRNDSIESLQQSLEAYTELHDENAHERNLNILFDLIWTSGLWTSNDLVQTTSLIDSPLVEPDDCAFAVSAITIALLERFDPLKLQLLGHAAQSVLPLVSVRALMGLAVTLVPYSDILPFFPEVSAMVSILSQVPGIPERMLKVQMALLSCRQTKEIDRRMREDIIPSMLSNPKLDDISFEDMASDDVSPDWIDRIEKSGVKDKLLQMTELQMEGADVYMSTFANLKSYPFFREPCNWFRVFNPNQLDVRQSTGSIAKLMLSGNMFCNSDKYSFALTFQQIPEQQRDMILSQVQEHVDEDILKGAPESAQLTETFTARQYAQDLYRFFNLFSRRHEFHNPFDSNLNLLSCSVLSCLVESDDSLQTIASWLLGKNYFQESVQAFGLMEAHAHPYCTDYRFYQQYGYAYQRCHDWTNAIESYERADILMPDNAWTLRHMAQCLKMTKQYDRALEMLLTAEKTDSDNLSLQIQIGDLMVDLKRFDDALVRFFKVDYLKPDYPKAWRAIAWCAFLAGRYDKSEQYFSKLLAGDASALDCLNAAHVQWVCGHVCKAVELYSRSLSMSERDKFLEEFRKDIPVLISKGISEQDIPLLLDSI